VKNFCPSELGDLAGAKGAFCFATGAALARRDGAGVQNATGEVGSAADSGKDFALEKRMGQVAQVVIEHR
jgi:hypothetical protein